MELPGQSDQLLEYLIRAFDNIYGKYVLNYNNKLLFINLMSSDHLREDGTPTFFIKTMPNEMYILETA